MPTTSLDPTAQNVNIATLDEAQIRALAHSLIERAANDARQIIQQQTELKQRQTKIDALVHEIRLLRHFRFCAKTEAMDAAQAKLFDEANAEDLSAAEQKLAALDNTPVLPSKPKARPTRQSLPAHLPRVDIAHEPVDTTCGCGQAMNRISQDVSERLDYLPGKFQVERHIRGVWACKCCEHLRQEAAVPSVIPAGIPTARLLAQVLIAKYDDHLPLYRQSEIYAREGVVLSSSTLADWVGACGVALAPIAQALKVQLLQADVLHADESPIIILGNKGDKQRGYIWAWASAQHEPTKAVVYQIKNSRSGQHAREFLRYQAPPPEPGAPPGNARWGGHLVVDDFAGYKALFTAGADMALEKAIMEVGCWAHVRRKFFELHVAAKSNMAQTMLEHIGQLYAIERALREQNADVPTITAQRQEHAKPRLQALHVWLQAQREQVSDGGAAAKAIDYTLKRWSALICYADDGRLPIDNNRIENQIRPWAVGRKNWLFSGSLAAGERAADIMSLIQTAKMNDIEPLSYLTDVLTRLPTHPNSRIEELLPTCWQSMQATPQ